MPDCCASDLGSILVKSANFWQFYFIQFILFDETYEKTRMCNLFLSGIQGAAVNPQVPVDSNPWSNTAQLCYMVLHRWERLQQLNSFVYFVFHAALGMKIGPTALVHTERNTLRESLESTVQTDRSCVCVMNSQRKSLEAFY